MIVGFGPGTTADLLARILGQRLSKTLGQQIVVENRPGAGSMLAAEVVSRAPGDGYMLFIASSANITNEAINPNLSVKIAKDFTPVALLCSPGAPTTTVFPDIATDHPNRSPLGEGLTSVATVTPVIALMI